MLVFYPLVIVDFSNSSGSSQLQRQDMDDRLRRLQSDKESLVLQVQVLTEQVAAQGEKISELERTVTEKQHLLNNADDLLRRVSLFANLVGVQIDKQKVQRDDFLSIPNSDNHCNFLFIILYSPARMHLESPSKPPECKSMGKCETNAIAFPSREFHGILRGCC